jgi:hypothetical protein
MINSVVNSLPLLPVLFIGSQLLREMSEYNERKRKAKEEALMAVNTGFTNLRQTVNLHPAISAGMKKKITAKSHVVQEMLISAITSDSDLNIKVIMLCDFLDKKNHELEQSVSEINNVESNKAKKTHQLAAAKNLAVEILAELEKAQSNDNR